MRVAVFSSKPYDRRFLEPVAQASGHELVFFEPRLTAETRALAEGFRAVCVFVNDQLDRSLLAHLAAHGLELVALRCAGFNNVDLVAAEEHHVRVTRVPAYSPEAVAEHTVGLILCLNRKLHIAFNRVRDGNFSLDRLLGFGLHGRTLGVVGTGRIGQIVARILHGFGSRILLADPYENAEAARWGTYVPLDELLAESHVVTLHCPLTPATHHMINAQTLRRMKPGVMLVNTSRGGLIDTRAVIHGLKSGHIGSVALDVYEEEADLFFEDLSGQVIQDDLFSRLVTFPNVLITGHQAFFTQEALEEIARVTMQNLDEFPRGEPLSHPVTARQRA